MIILRRHQTPWFHPGMEEERRYPEGAPEPKARHEGRSRGSRAHGIGTQQGGREAPGVASTS